MRREPQKGSMMSTRPEKVYKLLTPADWDEARARGYAEGADDRADGFVHLSTRAQLPGTAARHFSGIDPVFMLEFDCADLDGLRWEPGRQGEDFPHLYARLEIALATRSAWLRNDHHGLACLEENPS